MVDALSVCLSVCPGWGGVTSLRARSRGEPSSAHCEQRLSERLTPCPCDPVCACTGMRGHAFLSAHPHAAQRAVPGWRGGLGRVGADLASAGSMRPPPSPARHVSTAWLATKHVSRETARHHTRQARHGSAPSKNRLVTTPASRETARHHKRQHNKGNTPLHTHVSRETNHANHEPSQIPADQPHPATFL